MVFINKKELTAMSYFKLLLLTIILLFIDNNLCAQDWANLNKFQKANTELMNSNIQAKRIVFMELPINTILFA